MAFVVCEKHGGHGAAAVCSHIAARVLANESINQRLVPIKVIYAGQMLGPTWLCPECAERYQVRASGATFQGDEGFEKYWTEIGLKPICPRCFELHDNDLALRQALR